MSDSTGSPYHVVVPTGHEGLTCRFLKPDDFKLADVDPTPPDFNNAASFMPLAVAMTHYGPMVFSVAARPAFEDGTVAQWLRYLCEAEGFKPGPITTSKVGAHPAVACDVLQHADGVVMKSRLSLFEDGGRLFQVGLTAPEPFWDSALRKFTPMVESFELREVRGTRVPLHPGEEPPAIAQPEPPAPAPVPAPDSATAPSAAPNEPPRARMNAAELRAAALADNPGTLDPEHPTNANLRDRGVGLVPRIARIDPERRIAILGAGAIVGFIRVPFGWHVIDDGRRTLIFDGAHGVQVNLSLRPTGGRSTVEHARSLIKPHLEQQPDLPVIEVVLEEIACAAVRGVRIESEILDQYFLVRDIGRDGLHLVARVTASQADSTRAMDLAGDMVATFAQEPGSL